MSDTENFVTGMFFGFVLGVLITIIVFAIADDPVVEPPMQAHCEEFNSDLVRYNDLSFECENGARFMRYLVEG